MNPRAVRPVTGLLLIVPLLGLASLALAQNPPASTDPQWLKDLKAPCKEFNWGADLRLRHESIDNPFLIDNDPPGKTWSFNRYRGRVWANVLPSENVEFNARLAWEGRYWWEPNSRGEGMDPSEVVWDNLHFHIKGGDPKGTKFNATIGRQDIILGDGWLVLEGTPLDGSRTIFFDAARFNVSTADKTSFDLIYIENRSDPDSWLRPFSSKQDPIMEQDERGIIAWLSMRPCDKTQVDAYFIWKHDEAVLGNGDDGDVYTIGARVAREFNANWKARAEAAYQFGERNNASLFPNSDGELRAYGLLSRVTYSTNDSWKNQFYFEWEYLSGDDPGSGRNEGFDPLWGRWPQYSENYVYPATADARIAETSNMNRFNIGWMLQPMQNMSLSFSYHAMLANENPKFGVAGFSHDGYFRGHLLNGILQYKFNEHLSGHLWAECFIPGNYYQDAPSGPFKSREDPVLFLRIEFMITL